MKISEIQAWVKKQFTGYSKEVMKWAKNLFATKSELSSLFDDVSYDSEGKQIQFKHGQSVVKNLDATPFIKDGMVNTVTITDGKTGGANNGKKVLLITFNTDSGKEDIEIPLDNIFNASNYYTKTEADNTFVKSADWDAKTADFLTEDDLEDYAKSSDVYSKTEADSTFVKDAELTDITEAEFQAMFAEA